MESHRLGPGRRCVSSNTSCIFSNVTAGSDFSIFAWRMKSPTPGSSDTPALYLRDPEHPLPSPSEYRNPSFYLFRPKPHSSSSRTVQEVTVSVSEIPALPPTQRTCLSPSSLSSLLTVVRSNPELRLYIENACSPSVPPPSTGAAPAEFRKRQEDAK